MIYQLDSIERWIQKDIAPEALLNDFSEAKLGEYIDFVSKEKERIASYFREKTINGESPGPLGGLVEAHQVGFNAIIETITQYKKSTEVELPQSVLSFYTRVSQFLEGMLSFLQQHLAEYFNEEFPISAMNATHSKADLRKHLEVLQVIGEHPEIDKQLFRMITRPFREFVDEDKFISYRELAYLKELMVALKRIVDDQPDDIINEVHLTLLELNFNYPRYVLYYNYWLDTKLAEISGRPQRLDKLSAYMNAIEQVRFKPGYILIPGLPSVTDQLLISIKNTYRYLLEKDQQVSHSVLNQIGSREKTKDAKIKLAVSVPVLALFLKSLIKAGIITNENKAEVFRGVVENFTTLKSDSISYDSLKGKYNKTPPSAHVHLKKTLVKIMESIRSI